MATKRFKKNLGTKKEGTPNTTAVDRISKLPDPLIHHILSFVPTVDVVRMSVLSRRWKRVWYSVPALNFSDTDHMDRFRSHSRQPRQAFHNFVDKCLKHREKSMRYIADSVITRLKLHTEYSQDRATVLDNRLNFVVRGNIEDLDLSMKPDYFVKVVYYRLPEAILNARSLTVVKLDHLMIGGMSSVNLPSLISLSLTAVELCDGALHKLLLGCPALVKFLLSKCTGLLNPQISSSTLKFLEIEADKTYETLKVETINLQSLMCGGYREDTMNLSACKAIRSLSLFDVMLDDKSLEDLIFGFPLLESLTLTRCFKVKHIRICGQHLKSIRLERCCDHRQENPKVTIEAPNLVSFYYRGHIMCGISMNSRYNLLNGHIVIREEYSQKYDRDWYINLIIFLSKINFAWNTTVSLHVYSEEALIIPEKLKRICSSPWPNLKHLKVMTYCALKKKRELRDALYWVSPSLETLVIENETKGCY